MVAVVYDFEVEQGIDREQIFIYKDSENVPIDLTGYKARMQLRPNVLSSTVLLELTTENGGILLGSDGKVTLVFTEENTNPLIRGGVYDIELDSGDRVTRFMKGKIVLSKGITRNA